MYKITIKKTVGEVTKEITIETDNLELTKEILVSEEIIKVETDVPNESIDPDVAKLREIWKQQIADIWKNPQIPYTPGNPFTVTC
ncbi:hypothetical protein MVUOKPPV_CDS0068 [Klebsiella phage phi1_175008]|uniref:Uncharacterized protein n=2 Tax=Klebsiella phage phi1_175008 TaxID=3127744 RepID=A0AC61ZSV3_9CAUD